VALRLRVGRRRTQWRFRSEGVLERGGAIKESRSRGLLPWGTHAVGAFKSHKDAIACMQIIIRNVFAN